MIRNRILHSAVACLLLFSGSITAASACTGIRLMAKDGGVVYGRTMEWGAFDLKSRVTIIPRGLAFTGQTPDGENGRKWQSKYGVVGLDMIGKDALADGMNEKGLTVGLFYHPGVASYPEYDPARAADTITAIDLASYLLTQYTTLEEVRSAMENVRVVGVEEPAIGMPVQAHWMVTEPSGKSLVIEFLDGELRIFDNPLGVITNAPSYDWHMTNLRNYVNLSPVALPSKKIDQMDFAPLGGGSGMIGLPGDFTPPSRLVRAVAWTQTARPLPNADEGIYETFRILDNFDVPLGAAEGSNDKEQDSASMRSATLWTTAWDLSGRKLYFHTQHNRRVRMVDVGRVDFTSDRIHHFPMDQHKKQDIQDITPNRM